MGAGEAGAGVRGVRIAGGAPHTTLPSTHLGQAPLGLEPLIKVTAMAQLQHGGEGVEVDLEYIPQLDLGVCVCVGVWVCGVRVEQGRDR